MKPAHRAKIDDNLVKARKIIKTFTDNLSAEKARQRPVRPTKPVQKEAKNG